MSYKERLRDGDLTLHEEEFKRFQKSGWCFVAFDKVGGVEGICFLRDVIDTGMVPWDISDFVSIAFAFKTGNILRSVASLDSDPEELIDEWVEEWLGNTEVMTQRLRERIRNYGQNR